MKKQKLVMLVCYLTLLMASITIGQTTEHVEATQKSTYSFMDVVTSQGWLGFLIWAMIFLFGLAAIPLGIASIAQATTLRSRQYPFITKLLIKAIILIFILGLIGVAQGVINIFATLSKDTPDVTSLALSMSHALWSMFASITACISYIFFLLISILIIHFKFKNIPKTNP
jgi:hypothetical protein